MTITPPAAGNARTGFMKGTQMVQERLCLCAHRAALAVIWACCSVGSASLHAQLITLEKDGRILSGDVAVVQETPVASPQPPAAVPGQPAPMPGQPGQPMPMGDMPPQTPGAAAPANTATTRPNAPSYQVNPDELKVVPDADGRIQFSFNGQPWPDVLEWFARTSGRTLDWQELPADYLNLTLHRPYTLDEARDLLNRHLLARGYTFLQHAEGFSVVKIEKINPALVPRVRVSDLEKRLPHEFVKVSFDLQWLIADELVKELESLKSPNGKLIAMTNTNRLEAMDTVANLREISDVLGIEQSEDGRRELVREFPLKYVKATDVQKQLEKFLGIDSGIGGQMQPGMDPNMMAMIQQQQAQAAAMQAQMAAQAGGAAPSPARKIEVRLVSDMLRNRIIAHGPPDKIALIESFIRVADVPTGGAQSLDAMLKRVKVFRLASLDAEQFVQSMNEIGGLDPMTRLRADTKNNAVMVDGSLVDQFTIKSLIEKLDGSGRRFEVIPLRRNTAEEVAGSIEMLMGTDEDDSQQNNRSRYWDFGYFGYGGGGGDDRKKDKFRVGANVEYNQLLLWANDIELEEVRKLLVKLGEIPDPSGGSTVRTIEIPRGQSPAQILELLKQRWPSMAPNPLELPPEGSLPKEKEPAEKEDEEKETKENPLHETQERTPKRPPSDLITQTFIQAAAITDSEITAETESKPDVESERPLTTKGSTGAANDNPPATDETPRATDEDAERDLSIEELLRQDAEQEQDSQASSSPPPVRIRVGPDGNLIISSDDPAALNIMEELLESSIPPARNYHVFRLKYAAPLWVRFNLEDFFKEDKDENAELRRWWYGDEGSSDDRRQLGKRKKIKFIDDLDTSTIVVVGADEEQLAIIEELIKLYDVPEQVNSQNTRVTKLFHIKFSRASLIAATIKDAFIDLLSSNDKALQGNQGNGGQGGERPSATIIRNYGPPLPGGDQEREKKTSITFKGKLSLGVDDVTNTLIVSAEGESLLNIVGEIIEQLDQAAKPEAHIAVVPFAGSKNYEQLQKALQNVLATGEPQANPGAVPPGQPQPQQPYPYQPPQQPMPQQAQPVIIED